MEHFKAIYDAAMAEATGLQALRPKFVDHNDFGNLIQIEKLIGMHLEIAHNAMVQIGQIRVFGAAQANTEKLFEHMEKDHGEDEGWKRKS